MLHHIIQYNDGLVDYTSVDLIIKELFKSVLEFYEDDQQKALLVSRKRKAEDTIIDINREQYGDGHTRFVFGPCAVESYEQVAAVAKSVKEKGLKLLRGGAYKPRTSPYDFQ